MNVDMDLDCSSETMEPKERQRKPRNHAGPLPKVLYDMFVLAVRANKTQYPSGPDLKSIGFPKPGGGHTRRQKFKHWAQRMDICYDSETETENLIHKRTGKIIIPLEDFENSIRVVHENGGGKHVDLKTTLNIVHEKYTMGGRDFGMNRGVVGYVVDTCQECIMNYAFTNNGKNGVTTPIPICNGLLTPESCSMVAHIPNTSCIWFDKSAVVSSTESSTEFYPKLMSLISEMRGELPGIAKGNKETKGRFLLKLYTTLECIRSQKLHTKTGFQATEPYSHQMHDDIIELLSIYKQENIEQQFLSDMDLLLDVYRTDGYSDYFVRSLQASISLVCQREPDILKQQITHTNGLTLDYRDGIKYLPHCT